jgi:integrase
MPKLVHKRPAYSHHKQSNRGRVCIGGKYHYLPGTHDSAESWAAYWALIQRVEKGELTDGSPKLDSGAAQSMSSDAPRILTVAELVEKYHDYAEGYYRQHGQPTGESVTIKYAIQPVFDTPHYKLLVSEFRPRHLKDVRKVMIDREWSRRHINASIGRFRRMFVWGVEEELVTEDVAGALMMVKTLREGRNPAVREKAEVGAVSDETLEKIIPLVSEVAGEVIRFMRLTGCRPGEFEQVTVESIDRNDPECWRCVVLRHKTAYKGKRRTLHFNPKCQTILTRWIVKAGSGKVFPITLNGLQTAIARACKKLGIDQFGPNAIRHRVGTEARKATGLEGAQHLLGHANASTTEIYAELNEERARAVALAIG